MWNFELVPGQENCINALGQYYKNAIVIQWKETVTSNTVWFQHFEVLIIEYSWCFLFVFGTTAPSGPWPPHSRGF